MLGCPIPPEKERVIAETHTTMHHVQRLKTFLRLFSLEKRPRDPLFGSVFPLSLFLLNVAGWLPMHLLCATVAKGFSAKKCQHGRQLLDVASLLSTAARRFGKRLELHNAGLVEHLLPFNVCYACERFLQSSRHYYRKTVSRCKLWKL